MTGVTTEHKKAYRMPPEWHRWGRYRPLRTGRFRLAIGAHPSFTFRTINDAIVTRRYLAGDVFPSYFLTDHPSIGRYYFLGARRAGAGKRVTDV